MLSSPGGELPFGLEIADDSAVIINGEERAAITEVRAEGAAVEIAIEHYDATITASLSDDGLTMAGRWRKTTPEGESALAFAATRGHWPRFGEESAAAPPAPADATAIESVAGRWAVTFTDDDGPFEAVGEFRGMGDRVLGTFLTATGDYRYLEGVYEDGLLRLSTFDGAHAFLFHARARADGTLAGDFWSRDVYHATWTAERRDDVGADALLPDPFAEVAVTSDDRRFRFSFSDLDGNTVTNTDDRFAGKVVVIDLFGTWCPNCADLAPLLADWHRRYRDQGLEVVGLAFEFTGEPERDARVLRTYRDRFGIEFPLLLAGVSEKEQAAAALPDLSAVKSYPTTIMIGREGTVRVIHSGFAGPGTGDHYDALVAELEGQIETLLAEPAP